MIEREIEIYNKWFKSDADHTSAMILNALRDALEYSPSEASLKEIAELKEKYDKAEWLLHNNRGRLSVCLPKTEEELLLYLMLQSITKKYLIDEGDMSRISIVAKAYLERAEKL